FAPADREGADRSVLPDTRVRRAQIYTDWDGTSGTLMAPRYTTREGRSVFEGLDLVASRVAQLPGGDATSGRGVLVDFDGSVGTLARFTRLSSGEFERVELASGLPIQHQVNPTGNAGFV